MALPLQICKATSIHRSEAMTVGEQEEFKKVVVELPVTGRMQCPGIELVAFSRAQMINDWAIGNPKSELTMQSLKKIGSTKSYKARQEFLKALQNKCGPSQEITQNAISDLDPNEDGNENSYEGGCAFSLKW